MICTGRIPMGLRSTVDGITGNLWGLFLYAYYHAHFIMCIIMHSMCLQNHNTVTHIPHNSTIDTELEDEIPSHANYNSTIFI